MLVQLALVAALATLAIAAPLPLQRPAFVPTLDSVNEYRPSTSPERFAPFNPRKTTLQLSPEAVPPPAASDQGSWWSRWRAPWSNSRAAAPSTEAQPKSALLRQQSAAESEASMYLNPAQVANHEAIKLPGNGWDSRALAEMRSRSGNKPFFAEGARGKVWFVRPDGLKEMTGINSEIVRESIQKHAFPTVQAPSVAGSVARAGWMERLAAGARSWFGGLKYLKPF